MARGFLNSYFGFNRQQRNGLLVLMCISAMLLVIRVTYARFIPPGDVEIQQLPLVKIAMDSLHDDLKQQNTTAKKRVLFDFDPNTVSQDDLVKLGLSEKQAVAFIKFRAKGIVFTKKEDLKKVFVINDWLYDRLSPHVKVELIPQGQAENEQTKQVNNKTTQFSQLKPLDLNAADSLSLVELPGIGPAYAKRILKYRDLLGGYVSVDQLKEVYGLSEETFEKVKDKVFVENPNLRKIDLNKDEFKTINRHPYLGYELTKKVFDFRKKSVITPENLGQLIGDEVKVKKLLPYLRF